MRTSALDVVRFVVSLVVLTGASWVAMARSDGGDGRPCQVGADQRRPARPLGRRPGLRGWLYVTPPRFLYQCS